MIIDVVEASERDVDIVAALLKALYIELGDEAESVRFITEAFLLQVLRSGRTTAYLAITNAKEIAGIITVTESQAIYAGGKYGLLDEMYVVPSHRSNGIGAMLIEKIRSIAEEKGWKRVDVTAPTGDSERAVSFYQKCGFAFTGHKLKLAL